MQAGHTLARRYQIFFFVVVVTLSPLSCAYCLAAALADWVPFSSFFFSKPPLFTILSFHGTPHSPPFSLPVPVRLPAFPPSSPPTPQMWLLVLHKLPHFYVLTGDPPLSLQPAAIARAVSLPNLLKNTALMGASCPGQEMRLA